VSARPERRRLRLDELLVERRLAASRAEAARLILAGRVRLDGRPATKAGQLSRPDAGLELTVVSPYVGRGGEKLAAALAQFGIEPAGRVCLDVGASTGGFTDCLLQRGARHVYAVDVGRGQLHPRLRSDSRVTVIEGLNARRLETARLPTPPSLATVDVSFISLEKVIPSVAACLAPGPADLVALVKPQFEVGRGRVGKGGVVRDHEQQADAVMRIAAFARAHGLAPCGAAASPLRGAKGNREFFLHLVPGGARPLTEPSLEAAVEAAVADVGMRAPRSAGPQPRDARTRAFEAP
jgi:23S rRNA (cytidine1920-2'-O)/16S rRNA (cytidine1409-2'-O)-methyltransferase